MKKPTVFVCDLCQTEMGRDGPLPFYGASLSGTIYYGINMSVGQSTFERHICQKCWLPIEKVLGMEGR